MRNKLGIFGALILSLVIAGSAFASAGNLQNTNSNTMQSGGGTGTTSTHRRHRKHRKHRKHRSSRRHRRSRSSNSNSSMGTGSGNSNTTPPRK